MSLMSGLAEAKFKPWAMQVLLMLLCIFFAGITAILKVRTCPFRIAAVPVS